MAIQAFAELYQLVQQQKGSRISRTFLFNAARQITQKEVGVLCSGELKEAECRGYFLSLDSQSPALQQQFKNKNLIVFARGMNRCWTRFVQTKELMHLFDKEIEQTATPDELGRLLANFASTNITATNSPEYISDISAIVMALMSLCKEEDRVRFARQRSNNEITDLQIAEMLRIPKQVVPLLCGDDYKAWITEAFPWIF